MACVNNSMKIDSDIEMITESLESRGVIVDKLLYQHLMKIDGRLKGLGEKRQYSTQDLHVQLSTGADVDLSIPAPPLTRRVSIHGVKECPKCKLLMVRSWFSLKCDNPGCEDSK